MPSHLLSAEEGISLALVSFFSSFMLEASQSSLSLCQIIKLRALYNMLKYHLILPSLFSCNPEIVNLKMWSQTNCFLSSILAQKQQPAPQRLIDHGK